jgi:hypothetical protein
LAKFRHTSYFLKARANFGRKYGFVVGLYGFRRGLINMFWSFKLSFDEDILASVGLETVLGYFFQNLGKFFSNFLVTLIGSNSDILWPRLQYPCTTR